MSLWWLLWNEINLWLSDHVFQFQFQFTVVDLQVKPSFITDDTKNKKNFLHTSIFKSYEHVNSLGIWKYNLNTHCAAVGQI